MKKTFFWIIMFIVIAALGATVGFLMGNKNTGSNNTPTPTETTTTQTPEATLSTTTTTSVSATPTSSAQTIKESFYVTSSNGLNLREGPSTKDKIVFVIPFGGIFEADAKTDGWYHGSYKTYKGYVSAEFVSAKSPTTGWLSYHNSTYNFNLQLPNKTWAKYQTSIVTNPEGATQDIKFLLPTTDTEWAEYPVFNPFVITVYTTAQWNALDKNAPHPSKIGANSKYVFGFSTAQAAPKDLIKTDLQVDEIRATFFLN